jgi:hypothetical protein
MTKHTLTEVYKEIEDTRQFQEMLELAEEANRLLKEYIKKNKRNKEVIEEILDKVEEYQRPDLIS